jgi:hypothetical protein
MYVSIIGQGVQKRGYLLTIVFHYDEWSYHLSKKLSSQVKEKKNPLVKKTIGSINKASIKRAKVPLVNKTFASVKTFTYTSI